MPGFIGLSETVWKHLWQIAKNWRGGFSWQVILFWTSVVRSVTHNMYICLTQRFSSKMIFNFFIVSEPLLALLNRNIFSNWDSISLWGLPSRFSQGRGQQWAHAMLIEQWAYMAFFFTGSFFKLKYHVFYWLRLKCVAFDQCLNSVNGESVCFRKIWKNEKHFSVVDYIIYFPGVDYILYFPGVDCSR